jgi:hypothetical protein
MGGRGRIPADSPGPRPRGCHVTRQRADVVPGTSPAPSHNFTFGLLRSALHAAGSNRVPKTSTAVIALGRTFRCSGPRPDRNVTGSPVQDELESGWRQIRVICAESASLRRPARLRTRQLDRAGPGRRAGNCGHLAQPSVTTVPRGALVCETAISSLLPARLRPRPLWWQRYNRGQFLCFSATGVQGLVTTSPGGIRGPPRPLRRRRDLSPASSCRGRRESPVARAATRGPGWVRRRRS